MTDAFGGLVPVQVALASIQQLKNAPIFEEFSEGCLRMMALKMEHRLYLPGETVTKQGQLCHSMFFIYHGDVIVKDIRGKVVKQSSRDTHFGAVPMILGGRWAADVVVSHCIIAADLMHTVTSLNTSHAHCVRFCLQWL